MQVPKRKSEAMRRSGFSGDDHLTPAAIDRLKRTLADLQENQRPQAVTDLTAAREMGDLSENAAYTEAKSRLGRIDGRILSIQDRLKRAVVIQSGPDASGRIRVGSRVTLETNGKTRTYEVLGSQETNPTAGRISYQSPLGAALIGKRAGDEFTVTTNERQIDYRIIEVS